VIAALCWGRGQKSAGRERIFESSAQACQRTCRRLCVWAAPQ
jgi:hypothetical protein